MKADMTQVIKPTVGRKVYYRPSKYDVTGVGQMVIAGNLDGDHTVQPLDATILAVWGDKCINVNVLDICGRPFAKTSVTLLQPGEEPGRDAEGKIIGGYAYWMPYQQDQAKKESQPAPEVTADDAALTGLNAKTE
jgi:hypothetical protein